MAVIFNDTFTDTAGVALDSHTPDTGTSWTLMWSNSGEGLAIDATGTMLEGTSGASDGAIYTADTTYSSADYSVEVSLPTVEFGDNAQYIFARIQDVDNFYAAIWATGFDDSTHILKKSGGTFTTLSTYAGMPVDGSTVKLDLVGDSLSLYIDDALQASATDSTITAAGKAGIGVGGAAELWAAGDDIGSGTFDNFIVTSADVAVTHPLKRWTGTEWQSADGRLKRWNGSEWEDAAEKLKRYDGSDWS